MKTAVLALAFLLFTCSAVADQRPGHPAPRYCMAWYMPQEDITLHELAMLIPLLNMPRNKAGFYNYNDFFKVQPPEVLRHFSVACY